MESGHEARFTAVLLLIDCSLVPRLLVGGAWVTRLDLLLIYC